MDKIKQLKKLIKEAGKERVKFANYEGSTYETDEEYYADKEDYAYYNGLESGLRQALELLKIKK